MPDLCIFISYRIADTQVEARLLYTELANRFGADAVFLDKKRLESGADWPDELAANVGNASVLLVLIKDEAKWLGVQRLGGRRMDDPGDWVRREIETALADKHKRIIPLLVDGASLPPEADCAATVASVHSRPLRLSFRRNPSAPQAATKRGFPFSVDGFLRKDKRGAHFFLTILPSTTPPAAQTPSSTHRSKTPTTPCDTLS